MKEHKTFKCKDEVIYRFKGGPGLGLPEPWIYGIFSHYKKDGSIVVNGNCYQETVMDILPYEGNEHLVGTTDEPEEEVKLEKGEYVFVCDRVSSFAEEWILRIFDGCWSGIIYAFNNVMPSLAGWKYAIRFKDFNPNDMEETKKHILCVKGGKIVKYKD